MLAIFKNAWEDLRKAFRMRAVWFALASEDITDQHRRTMLGPLWILANYLILTGIFVVIFGQYTDIENFPVYVGTALLVWLYLSELLVQSVTLFSRNETFISGTVLPISVYVLRMAMQGIIRLLYVLIGCAAIIFVSGTPMETGWLYALLALVLIVATTPAIITVFAILGAYFPDVQFIISNLVRIGMFLTPIFWAPDKTDGLRHMLYIWNPFTYVVEIFRTPILTGQPHIDAFAICLSLSMLLWVLALSLLGKYRDEIVFVL